MMPGRSDMMHDKMQEKVGLLNGGINQPRRHSHEGKQGKTIAKRFPWPHGCGIAGVTGSTLAPSALEKVWAATTSNGMIYRKLGRSGERVSAIGLGGYHIGVQSTEEESIRIIRAAIDNGINFMDNCWDYNDGASEIRMGKALRDGYRKKVFLMTKSDAQVKDLWNKQLDESLRRLQTDVIDLIQFHEVIRMGDPDRIFGPNGAFEAA